MTKRNDINLLSELLIGIRGIGSNMYMSIFPPVGQYRHNGKCHLNLIRQLPSIIYKNVLHRCSLD